ASPSDVGHRRQRMSLSVRRVGTLVEEIRTEGGASDGEPLRKAAAWAVIANPYAGRALVPELTEIVAGSGEVGALLGRLAVEALAAPVESYGKAALVGTNGEQEHANACITTVFGNALREAVGGGRA